jgi:hypothetical protein
MGHIHIWQQSTGCRQAASSIKASNDRALKPSTVANFFKLCHSYVTASKNPAFSVGYFYSNQANFTQGLVLSNTICVKARLDNL